MLLQPCQWVVSSAWQPAQATVQELEDKFSPQHTDSLKILPNDQAQVSATSSDPVEIQLLPWWKMHYRMSRCRGALACECRNVQLLFCASRASPKEVRRRMHRLSLSFNACSLSGLTLLAAAATAATMLLNRAGLLKSVPSPQLASLLSTYGFALHSSSHTLPWVVRPRAKACRLQLRQRK